MPLPIVGNPAYGLLMLVGIAVSALVWSRMVRPAPEMVLVYAGGLLGALLGAKLVFLIVEWPLHAGATDFWMQALVGRTITGGLLGGYGGVEIAKRLIGHTQPTGDGFAVVVPIGLTLGRIGCFLSGCCLGCACEPSPR